MTIADPIRKYRVAQWHTGHIGKRAMSAVFEHPNMELVGVKVHSPEKIGMDAGAICGSGETYGIAATGSGADILALRPDCVVYTPNRLDLDDLCAILASGANVVTSIVEFHHVASLEPEVRARVEEACRTGGSSLHSTGGSPGFVTEVLPVTLCMMQRRLDCLTIDEYADISQRNSPSLLFDYMGWGKPATAVSEKQIAHASASFGESFHQLADCLGIAIDRIEATGHYGTSRERLEIPGGVIEAGTAAATRVAAVAYRGEAPVMKISATWYATRDLEQDWDLRPNGWRVQVDGDTPLDVNIAFVVPPERFAAYSRGLTAHPVVNAIPAVCEAAPGIRTAIELQVVPVFT